MAIYHCWLSLSIFQALSSLVLMYGCLEEHAMARLFIIHASVWRMLGAYVYDEVSQACVRDHQLKTIDTYREPAAAGISQVKLVRVSSHRPVLETNCWVLACRSCADWVHIHMNIHRSGC